VQSMLRGSGWAES